MPRVSKRTPIVEEEILRRLSAGEPLAWICREEHLPHMTTWREWCRADESLDIAHSRARDEGFDVIAADTLRIADTHEIGETVVEKPDGSIERKTEDMLGHRKLRIETRLKLLAKWDPKRYGEATMLKHADADGGKLDMAGELAARRAQVAEGKSE